MAPQIKDMILIGQEGTSNSVVTRNVSISGGYVYCSGQPGLQTINISDPANLILTDDYTNTSLQPNASTIQGNVVGDFDNDSDIDQNDFIEFIGCINGPNQPPGC